jgi:hypothetical protein
MDTRQKAIQINMDSSKYGAFTAVSYTHLRAHET